MKNNAFVRTVSRILIASLICLPLQSQAELIAATQLVSAASAQSARAAVAVQLEVLGVNADSARDRVAALTDAEVLQLATRIDDAPTGGFWPVLLLAIFLIWRFGYSEQAQADQKAREPAKEPAKK